jgi:hypothetical protein
MNDMAPMTSQEAWSELVALLQAQIPDRHLFRPGWALALEHVGRYVAALKREEEHLEEIRRLGT